MSLFQTEYNDNMTNLPVPLPDVSMISLLASELPSDPANYMANETLRRQQFVLSTSELPLELRENPFYELYNVYKVPFIIFN